MHTERALSYGSKILYERALKIMDLENKKPSQNLTLCPICNCKPNVAVIKDLKSNINKYKCFCSNIGTHISCGDWKASQKLAEEDWEHRVKDQTQPDLIKARNVDVIKKVVAAMNEEELAEFLTSGSIAGCMELPEYTTKEKMLSWLMMESECQACCETKEA